ncbi:MAG: hypothetical protein OIF56_06770, partial [Cohaesibacter sp.]|nr:hypothetical protein [Cohaesibacter sp.]
MCYTNRMAEMAKYPGLDTRGRIYYIRRRIPEDVRKLIIANFRAWQKLTKPQSPFPSLAADRERQSAERQSRPGRDTHSPRNYTNGMIGEAKRLLTGNQFAADEDKAKILSGYLRRADSLLFRRDIQRLESNFADLPLDDDLFQDRSVQSNVLSLASRETGGVAQITIKQAYDLHKQDLISDETHPKTLLKINYVEQLIYHIFGPDTPIQSINRMAARRYVDVVSKLPANWGKKKEFKGLSAPEVAQKAEAQNIAPCRPRTAKGNIDRLDTFFEWAVREEITDKNPVKGLLRPFAKKAKKEPKRQSFTIEDLKLIFGSDYRNHIRPYGVSKKEPLPPDVIPSAAHFWVPLISLFSGMRLSEACQLTLAEVHKIKGITCFEVLDFDDEALEDDLSEDDVKILRSKKNEAFMEKHGFVSQ